MRKLFKILFLITVVNSQVVWAGAVIGVGETGPSIFQTYNAEINNLGGYSYYINEAVSYDPDAGPWLKSLKDPNGDNIFADDSGTANSIFHISETITVGPGTSWTDWHEEILEGSGWIWQGVNWARYTLPGATTSVNAQIEANGSILDFFFDDLLTAGAILEIDKTFAFLGTDLQWNTGDIYTGTLTIAQHPTVGVPEPATLALMGLALAGLGFTRRKKA